MIAIIAAIGENRELGKDNQLLWHLPKDLQHFKKLTLNHPMIMGRKTFESLPGILPDRLHIVITQNIDYKSTSENVVVVHSLDEAIKEAQKQDDTIFIIGGGQIFKEAMPLADKMYLTIVRFTFDADTFFPEIPENFILIYREFHPNDSKNPYAFEFQTWEKA